MANKAGPKQYSKRQTQQPRPATPIGEVLGTISGLKPKSLRTMLAVSNHVLAPFIYRTKKD